MSVHAGLDERLRGATELAAQGDLEDAARQLEDLVRDAPEFSRGVFALALVLETLGRNGEAIVRLRACLAQDPTWAAPRERLSALLRRLGEAEEAHGLSPAPAGSGTDPKRTVPLLGTGLDRIDGAMLIAAGGFERMRSPPGSSCFRSDFAQVVGLADGNGMCRKLVFALSDPARSGAERDRFYRVSVVGADGIEKRVDLGTAATLVFLREALGVDLTRAAGIYAEVLGSKAAQFGDITVRFAVETIESDELPGLVVEGALRPR